MSCCLLPPPCHLSPSLYSHLISRPEFHAPLMCQSNVSPSVTFSTLVPHSAYANAGPRLSTWTISTPLASDLQGPRPRWPLSSRLAVSCTCTSRRRRFPFLPAHFLHIPLPAQAAAVVCSSTYTNTCPFLSAPLLLHSQEIRMSVWPRE